ncbi:MAG: hypothetical protein Q7N50_06135 [Armatimonadota bacterium]|nr:hypothetical protein [Armatimonadota bacterium]
MASSRECVVCSWRGRFDFDPETIRKAMEELSSASANEAESYFSTNQALDEYLSPESHPPNRLVAWLRRKLGL